MPSPDASPRLPSSDRRVRSLCLTTAIHSPLHHLVCGGAWPQKLNDDNEPPEICSLAVVVCCVTMTEPANTRCFLC